MECKELFTFENGQPLTTPPPQVSFWAFRLTVPKSWNWIFIFMLLVGRKTIPNLWLHFHGVFQG